MEVVIVGGGPVGCWTALQVKARRPDARITVYERHEAYQRDHVLTIHRRSFLFWARWGEPRQDGSAILDRIFALRATCKEVDARAGSASSWRRRLPSTLDIRTLDLERVLKARCRELGVAFVHKEVRSPEDAMGQHPSCDWFVAADGAHSRMRTALLGRDCLRRRDLFPSLDFNYSAHGQPGYLRVNTYLSLGHVYAENIGREADGVSAVNIRMIVSKAQYDAVPQATFKRPLLVTPDAGFWSGMGRDPHYGRSLKEDFYELLALRARHAGEAMTDAPVTMTKVHLSQYYARRFSATVQRGGGRRVSWFLVGDAAMGMPFYRAINSGMILGSQLAFVLAAPWLPGRLKAAAYDGCTRPFRIVRESVRIARTQALIAFVKDVARPTLLALGRSPFWPLLEAPLDRVVGWLKHGRLYRPPARGVPEAPVVSTQ